MSGVSQLYMWIFNCSGNVTFPVFQLNALVVGGPATSGDTFAISLDRVAIPDRKVLGVLLCGQSFVRSPEFTQRNFSSVSDLKVLSGPMAIAESITSGSVHCPWSSEGTACAGQVVSDLRDCWDRFILNRRTANDKSERWYHGDTPSKWNVIRTLGVNFRCCRRRASRVGASCFAGSWSSWAKKIRSSSIKRNKKISRSPEKLPLKFEIASPTVTPQMRPLVEDPGFASALTAQASCGKFRRSGRDGLAAPVFQMDFP